MPFTNKASKAEEGETRLVQVKKHGDQGERIAATKAPPCPQGQRPARSFSAKLDARKSERRDKAASSPRGESDKQRHGRASNVWMAPNARSHRQR